MILQLLLSVASATSPLTCDNINSQIAALPPAGGEVVLGPGTYSCKAPIIINRDNVSLRGAGSSKTILRVDDGLALPVVVLGEPKTTRRRSKQGLRFYPIKSTRNLAVSGLTINGNRHTHSNQKEHECYDFKKQMSTFCGEDPGYMIRNNGITIRAAHSVVIEDVVTHGHLSGGIVLEKISSDILIDGFKSYDNFFDGFAGYETRNCTVRNFELNGNGYSGISVDIDFQGNIFEDGRIFDNGDNGVFSAQVGHNIYRRLEIANNSTFGFYFDGSRQKLADGTSTLIPNSCDGNAIIDTQISGGKAGVYVNHICQNILLESVSILHPTLNCTSYFPGSLILEKGLTCAAETAAQLLSGEPQ